MSAKKFKFRLDPLLKLRENREKERQREHAEAAEKVLNQKQHLEQVDRSKLQTLDHQRNRLAGQISVAEALIYSRYLMKLRKDRLTGTELLRGLEKEAERRRARLVEAARERKTFELLKEKQKLRHLTELEKGEQKDLDEVATTGFVRNKRKGQRA
jgi:flagellar FliJ protein